MKLIVIVICNTIGNIIQLLQNNKQYITNTPNRFHSTLFSVMLGWKWVWRCEYLNPQFEFGIKYPAINQRVFPDTNRRWPIVRLGALSFQNGYKKNCDRPWQLRMVDFVAIQHFHISIYGRNALLLHNALNISPIHSHEHQRAYEVWTYENAKFIFTSVHLPEA